MQIATNANGADQYFDQANIVLLLCQFENTIKTRHWESS